MLHIGACKKFVHKATKTTWNNCHLMLKIWFSFLLNLCNWGTIYYLKLVSVAFQLKFRSNTVVEICIVAQWALYEQFLFIDSCRKRILLLKPARQVQSWHLGPVVFWLRQHLSDQACFRKVTGEFELHLVFIPAILSQDLVHHGHILMSAQAFKGW